ncbi:FtsK/SpoIIIE domain-containing protein [Sporichthya polymorpha]|uniref:FtsK/SpoIIIE domain-containing protein n=1 Tax=Sporichthya polymorpha TaxID=35751 RepID=UPI00036EE544|nr:FtsK/SpoIIIE domain-containing protein [Sporichthya polymorpha]
MAANILSQLFEAKPTPAPAPDAVEPISAFPSAHVIQVLCFALLGIVVLVVFGVKFWRTALALTAIGAVVVLGGPWAPAALALCLLTVVVVWRLVFTHSWRSQVRPRLQAWWARWYRYGPRWRTLCERHGLFVRDVMEPRGTLLDPTKPAPVPRSRLVRARLRKVVWSPTTERLLVELPDGMAPSDVAKIVEPFAHATRSLGCRVGHAGPGQVWIELLRRDPLARTINALPISRSVDLRAVPVGRCEDGSPWTLPVMGTHVLVAGSTGSGKGSVMWSLLRGLAPAIAEGTVEVWGFDPKGGMELALGAGMFARLFTDDPDSMAQALEDCADLLAARTKTLAGITRLHTPTVEEPLRVVLIDELAALTALAERKTVQRVDNALRRILTQGRAPGCVVVGFLQDPGKDVLAYRNLFPTRVALRLAEAVEVDMVLGEGVRARGAEAHRIDINTPGVGWVRHESLPDPIRVRAAYLTDDQIRAMAERHPARVHHLAHPHPVADEPAKPYLLEGLLTPAGWEDVA